MAFTEYIEEFDGGFLQPLTVKNSDEVDSSLHSLQEKVDSRIIGKQCLRLPRVDCELSLSCQGCPKHLVASSKKIKLNYTKYLLSDRKSSVPGVPQRYLV